MTNLSSISHLEVTKLINEVSVVFLPIPSGQLPDLHDQLPSTHNEWVEVTKETHGMAGDPRGVDIAAAEKVIQSMCEQLLTEII